MFNITKEEWIYLKDLKGYNKFMKMFIIIGLILKRSIFMRFLCAFTVLLTFFLILFLPTFIQTKIEVDTFNKFSSTKATFIEALFTELRVIPN